MDRGHRALLIAAVLLASSTLAGVGNLAAQGGAGGPVILPGQPGGPLRQRIEQLPPGEREAFLRNLRLWRTLPPEERQMLRNQAADELIRIEIEKAYQESGLRLDKDQREIFGVRYRQERRKLERELQEKLNAERARRLPAMLDGLRREFSSGRPNLSPAPVAPSSAPAPRPSVSVPAASPR